MADIGFDDPSEDELEFALPQTPDNAEIVRQQAREDEFEGGPGVFHRAFRTTNVIGGAVQRAYDRSDFVQEQDDKAGITREGESTDLFDMDLGVDWQKAADDLLDENDPDYIPGDHYDEITKGIPFHEREFILEAGSKDEAMWRKGIVERELEDLQYLGEKPSGITASLIAGILDIDTLLEIPLGPAGWAAKGASLTGKVSRGVAQGAAIGTAGGIADTQLHATAGANDVMIRVLAGMGLTGGLAPFAKTSTAMADNILRNSMNGKYANGDSVGSARNPNRPPMHEGPMTGGAEDVVNAYRARFEDEGIAEQVDAAKRAEKSRGERVAEAMEDKAGEWTGGLFDTVWNRGWNSYSTVAKTLTYDLFENASGSLRNNATAANLMEIYTKRISGHVMQPLKEAGDSWAKRNGYTRTEAMLGKHKEAFGREVTLELNHRRLHNKSSEGSSPEVHKAADGIERGGVEALERVAKDIHGNLHVKGMEDVVGRGYTMLKWKAIGMDDMRAAGATETDLEGLFMAGYRETLPHLDEDQLRVLSSAVIRRTTAKGIGVDESLVNLLSADGRSKLREDLIANGVPEKDAERLVEALSGKVEERGKAGFAKSRTEIDLSAEYNGYKLIDLVDSDLEANWAQYARAMGGRAALARKGITSFDQISKIKDAIKREQKSIEIEARRTGRELEGKALSDEDIDDMFSYFEGGPIAGGINQNARRMKQATNLAYLSGLGLTQGAELGAQIAAVGFRNFFEKVNLKQAFSESPELVKEFERMMGPVGQDHALFPDHLTFDWSKASGDQGAWMDMLDAGLGKGARMQGIISGFYKMRTMQQRWAVEGMVHKLDDIFQAGDPKKIVGDIGLSGDTLATIKAHYADSVDGVTRDSTGKIIKMNLDKLPENVQEEFALAMNRHTNQIVQKSMAGEDMPWMHKTMGALFSHLLNFPILAYRKQTARNLRNHNAEAMIPLIYGLMSAGVVVYAKDVVNGREPTPERVMLRAFGYSNMTGFVPMIADPLASVFGMDDIRFNRYGANTDLLGMPALGALNDMARVPGGLLSALDGSITASDAHALQALPVIGSAYGFHRLMNGLKN